MKSRGSSLIISKAYFILSNLIKLRLSEGYTEEDFYKVIDKMTECWLSNGELEQYLRPITLFGDNFDSYLNEDWERQETDWQSQYY